MTDFKGDNKSIKKILILTAKIGSGHFTPALAVKSAIEKLYPTEFSVELLDFAYASDAGITDKMLKSSWNGALTFPFLTDLTFKFLNLMYPALSSKNLCKSLFWSFRKKGAKFLNNYKPDLVFSTHFLCSSIACHAREIFGLQYEVITFMTDPFGGHKLWADERIDEYLVSTPAAKKYLENSGMKSEKITIIPYPLKHEKIIPKLPFIAKTERKTDMQNKKKTILISYGGQGIGRSYKIAKNICKNNLEFNLIIVTGSNRNLFSKLEKLRNKTQNNTNLVIKGFVDNMDELISKSDLLISKAGPASVFESIAGKCPVMITHWVGLNEKFVLDFCIENKIGFFAKNQKDIIKFLLNPSLNDILNDAIKNMDSLQMSGKIMTPLNTGAKKAALTVTDRFYS